MDDVRAVMDAVGSKRAAIMGVSEGGPMTLLFAATYPERTAAAIICGSTSTYRRDRRPPLAPRARGGGGGDRVVRKNNRWGTREYADERLRHFGPTWGDTGLVGPLPPAEREPIDPRRVEPDEHGHRRPPRVTHDPVPILLLHRKDQTVFDVREMRYLAERIPGAEYIEMPGRNHAWFMDPEDITGQVERFLTGLWKRGEWDAVESDRVLATVLFTDIVGSTEKLRAAGDAGWKETVRQAPHPGPQIARFRGVAMDTAGDGFFARFDGPARAIRCACAISGAVKELGIDVRAGLHTGECEVMDGKVGGIAVYIGLASRRTRDRVRSSCRTPRATSCPDPGCGSMPCRHRAEGDPRHLGRCTRSIRHRPDALAHSTRGGDRVAQVCTMTTSFGSSIPWAPLRSVLGGTAFGPSGRPPPSRPVRPKAVRFRYVPKAKIPVTIVASGNGLNALPAGIAALQRGASALDAVEACGRIVEADPADRTVGLGGLPNVLGEVELDASIVDGTTHAAGSVAALARYLHPITIARAVMERLPHVMLVGAGAARFAREIDAEPAHLLTDATRDLWIERLREAKHTPDSIARARALAPVVWETVKEERGTVNFIALDARGNIASAVTTSGWGYKYPGRVGDSPIVGAGNYCDSRHGGATCTGFGELAMRCVTAKTAVDRLAAGATPEAVARAAIADANALKSPRSRLNIVVLAANGEHAAATTRRGVQYAYQRVGMRKPALVPRVVVRRHAP